MGSWYVEAGRTLTTCKDVLRYRLLRLRLDFAPGARYAYNNTGYCWLDLIAETVDGRPLDPLPGMALMLHKPTGVTCAHKEAGELVYSLLPSRWRMRRATSMCGAGLASIRSK
jgi:hypothetical protein